MSVAPEVMRQAARDQIYPPRRKIQRAFFRADVPVSRQNIVNGVVHIADSAVIPRRISLKGQRADKAELEYLLSQNHILRHNYNMGRDYRTSYTKVVVCDRNLIPIRFHPQQGGHPS